MTTPNPSDQRADAEPIAQASRRRFFKPFFLLIAAFALGFVALARRIVRTMRCQPVGIEPAEQDGLSGAINAYELELAGDVAYVPEPDDKDAKNEDDGEEEQIEMIGIEPKKL